MPKPTNIINTVPDDYNGSWGSYIKGLGWVQEPYSGKAIREWILGKFETIENSIDELLLDRISSKYTLTLNNEETLTSIVANENTIISLSLYTPPQRSGYLFNGWYTGKNGSGTKVTNWTSLQDETLYAKWTQILYGWFFGSDIQLTNNEILNNLINTYLNIIPGTISKTNITTYNYYVLLPNDFSISKVVNSNNINYTSSFIPLTILINNTPYKLYKYTREVQANITLMFTIN